MTQSEPTSLTRQEMMEIHKMQNENHARTRDLQWKFNITLWTFMAAAIYFANNNTYKITPFWKWSIFVFFLLAEFLFERLSQKSLSVSRSIGNEIINQLSSKKEFSLNFKTIAEEAKIGTKGIGWIFFQLLVTAGLGIVLMFVME